jgi:3-hydroxyisobutyrate dehydrogenase-like beta-hydroxyacid dehydrogenase
LGHLGENLRYIGANIAAAAALDMAILAKVLGQTVGAVHAARVCEAEGVSVDTLASMLSDNDDVKGTVQAIHTSNFGNPGATIEVWNHAVHRILLQSRDAEINRDVPEFISELFKRAIAMGHDQEHIAALIKVLRAS